MNCQHYLYGDKGTKVKVTGSLGARKQEIGMGLYLDRMHFCRAMHKQVRLVLSYGVCLSVTFEYCVETAKDTAPVAMECEYELSNGTIFYDLE